MQLSEQELAEAMGVGEQYAAAQGAKTETDAGNAEKADETTTAEADTGENEQEVAEPDETENDTDEAGAAAADDEQTEDAPGTDGKKQQQTPEERHAAAARRKAEEQVEREMATQRAVSAAVEAERAKVAQEWDRFFAEAGLTNPDTETPIKTKAEYDAWREAYKTDGTASALPDGGLTPEALNRIIAETPVMKQAQALIEQQAAEREQRLQADIEARIAGELAKIHEMDSSVSTIEDLQTMDNAEAFRQYVERGNNFLDAFKLANWEKLEAQKAQAAKKQALANARSKDHLTATGAAKGAGSVPVPADELELFRALNPNKTDAEIAAYYNKHNRKDE